MRDIERIIVHCSATRPEWMADAPLSEQVAEIRRWHVEANGWSDIGYHLLIGRSGDVLPGRPMERIGAHTRGFNTRSIGVCLIGGHGSASTDQFSGHFTREQAIALRAVLASLKASHGQHIRITGHNSHAKKACPGFQVSDFLASA
jgi:hypothetical protein